MSAGPAGEPRETSGATTALLLAHVRHQGGDGAVEAVLRHAGVPHSAAELSEPSRWTSYDTRIRLFTAATEVLGEPRTMFRVGREALGNGLHPALVLLVRTMGSPRQVYRQLPRAVAKFSTTSTMRVLAASGTSATLSYTLHEGYRHSRLDCEYAQGLIGMVPTIFGLPPADLEHPECESDGHPACVYRLSWQRRGWQRGARRRPAADPELVALRQQLGALQSAAADLVASEDADSVLQRIVERAAAAVLAPGYLLAVADPAGGPPRVHAAGVPEDQRAGLAATLLAGGDPGPHVVAVDVTSARRHHGRLAVVYRPGGGELGHEQPMLAAYAGYAAAALDLVLALDSSREEADRAGALLGLAHELSGATEAAAVSAVVAEALPRVVGCHSAAVLLWDPASGCLRASAAAGHTGEAAALLHATPLHAEDVPELVGMLADRAPRFLRPQSSSPVLRDLLLGMAVGDVVAVPVLAGRTFLGVVTAGWPAGRARGLVGDTLARLRGVGDQAATALQRARLLETVRHQATHDVLTGLPNRVLFLDTLAGALAGAGAGQHVGVLFCDLDRFKAVNDSLGHAAGDELLRQVAARLRAAVRPGDTVGRLSGDEFAVVLPALARPGDAGRVVDRVTGCFTEPFRLEGTRVDVGVSVGVAVHGGPGGDPGALLRTADAEMYRHKKRTPVPPQAVRSPRDPDRGGGS
ncbi:diguanylate cyclase (GGDEF) domain-containing protein [Geodermatophilus pulveris]|uniref:Diguanylate cyclase (GGDEF) domain-containing protein n=1 Tax=Geodermatophilus pulveris TaxID=1564159 RepID=A0A239I040_9ACTN|nr:sensor domain-containing diguanylate cyclase [Geodermatophilus pulveris]SNS86373.1 diguanylate cyclase (GGDEF) domain-containing protein [Geodermatophilus pulveris]